MILYQMCALGEVKAIKVNNPATIRGQNAGDCEEMRGVGLNIKRMGSI